MRNVSNKSFKGNQNKHFLELSVYEKVEKFCTAGQATDDNMAHAHCMLDTKVYKHTPRICKT